jgi:hypothetical protein
MSAENQGSEGSVAVDRKRLCKHVHCQTMVATYTHATRGELLEAVFSVLVVLRLYI